MFINEANKRTGIKLDRGCKKRGEFTRMQRKESLDKKVKGRIKQ